MQVVLKVDGKQRFSHPVQSRADDYVQFVRKCRPILAKAFTVPESRWGTLIGTAIGGIPDPDVVTKVSGVDGANPSVQELSALSGQIEFVDEAGQAESGPVVPIAASQIEELGVALSALDTALVDPETPEGILIHRAVADWQRFMRDDERAAAASAEPAATAQNGDGS